MTKAKKKLANEARIAEACTGETCSHVLVRGDLISFVSTEQVKVVGRHPLSEAEMPSDIVLPADFVLVHDTSGFLFDRCHMHIVRWRGSRRSLSGVPQDDVRVAHKYFGRGAQLAIGDVEIPKGPWARKAKVEYIRYRRAGYAVGNYEHDFKPGVWLYASQRPLAWKLSLPDGCVVDARGFVKP